MPAVRQRLEELWPGARVNDHHGMTEVGPVSFECPRRPGVLHVIETAYYAEVINPATLQPVGPGETGELVLSTLGRLGSPLLRYRTGDLVKPEFFAGQPCACGRYHLALEGGILGRVDDMVVVRGVNVYPSAIEEIVRGCGGIAEYRVLVSRRGALVELQIDIEPTPEITDVRALVEQLQHRLTAALTLRVPVNAVATGALPRFEMKARRWVAA
jgi:phenylacetate-CoA ligase